MSGYLRLEAVNLGNFVYDTADLSTIRGGGLMLLDSIKELEAYLQQQCQVRTQTIIQGASTGLFKILESPLSLADLATRANSWLRSEYPHATFVLDTSLDLDFVSVNTRLTNANRIRQMKAPSLIYPKLQGVTPATPVCELDLVRPGPKSEASLARKDYGKKNKQELYWRILLSDGGFRETDIADLKGLAYAHELNGLAGDSDQWGNLRDKMAIIVVDGNGIGTKSRENCNTPDSMAAFSKQLREQQAKFLHSLLSQIAGQLSWKNAAGEIRLETLVWGGDEVIWVVPAWKGFDLLQLFYNHLKDWPKIIPGQKITFAAGIVFCNHKSPIHSVRDLAKDLCDRVKAVSKDSDIIAYQVLESFDNVAEVNIAEASIETCGLRELIESMPDIRASVPRRKLHELARSIRRNDLEEDRQAIEKKTLKDLDPAIASPIRGNWHLWGNIIDLWDYLSPEEGGL